MGDEALSPEYNVALDTTMPESDESHVDHEGLHPEYQQQEIPQEIRATLPAAIGTEMTIQNSSSVTTVSVDGTNIGVVSGWDYSIPSFEPADMTTIRSLLSMSTNPSGEMPFTSFSQVDPSIAFYIDEGLEIFSVTKDGFFVKGEQVSEGSSVYKAFCEWLQISRGQNGLNNFSPDPLKEKPVIPLLSRYDLLKNHKL